MKTRIFGSIFVVGILVLLYVLTEGNSTTQTTQGDAPMSIQSDADFKALKIN